MTIQIAMVKHTKSLANYPARTIKKTLMIKPRFSKGSGQPPVHLASIHWENSNSGTLVFVQTVVQKHLVAFSSRAELLTMLNCLVLQRVPFAVGGMCPGPADEFAMLIASSEMEGNYIELSWSGPQQWIVREISQVAHGWQVVPDVDSIVNTSFDPRLLKRTKSPE